MKESDYEAIKDPLEEEITQIGHILSGAEERDFHLLISRLKALDTALLKLGQVWRRSPNNPAREVKE